MEEKLQRLLARHEELAELLARPEFGDSQEFVRLSKEYAELNPVVEAIKALREARKEASGLDEIIADQATESEMRDLAQEELPAARRGRRRARTRTEGAAAAQGSGR